MLLVLAFITIAVLVSGGGLLVLAALSTPQVSVPERATLSLRLDAPFSEIDPPDVLSQIIPRSSTLRATLDVIRKAKADARVRTLVIRPSASGALWAQLQEVRAAIEDFKTSKKPVTAFLESAGAAEYYLASAADRIVLMPAGQLDVTGLASYELFFRQALDKIGVYPDLLHVGEYKTASNTFTERGFTPAHREMSQSLNRDWYEQIVRAVAQGRTLSEAEARSALERGPYMGEGAVKARLVDELGYEDQLDDRGPMLGTQSIDGEQYGKGAPAGERREVGGRIALLYAIGTIASGKSSFDAPSGAVIGSDTFNQWLRKVRVDPGIRAVIIRIDSPGGSAIASEVIWREIMLTRDVKPVIVSMGDVAASGGYYMAAAADAIVADPGTLTGSIGVLTGKFVLRGTLDKIGIGVDAVSDGTFAQMNSPFRPFSPEERRRVEDQLQATYELFLKRVADGRRQATTKIDAVAQGRVWTGRQAREIGLVDELGGLADAVRLAKQRAKLDAAKDVDLVIYPPRRTLYDLISNPFGVSGGASAAVDALFRRPDVRMIQSATSMLNLFRRGEPLAILPNVFVH
ncbi:MAG: signal peptide peptidase SppA [Acidobacteria bacterium]|nr:signal peptide peptidase SppA [Acidobacteriota bacterium]